MENASQPLIHPTAVVDPSAQLAPDVRVGPYALIGPRVVIGAGNTVEGHAVVASDTRMGQDNIVHHHAVLGADSQDMKYQGETTALEIGDCNVFREFVTVNRATGEGKATRVGNHCRLLAYAHVAHNCTLGDGVIISNSCQLAGEVTLEDNVLLGGIVGIHQFCRVGAHSIVGACSKVTQDILPYAIADGHPARPYGLNLVGLKRFHFPKDKIARIKQAYHTIFHDGHRLEEALEILEAAPDKDPHIEHLAEFIRLSRRNIARPRNAQKEPGITL